MHLYTENSAAAVPVSASDLSNPIRLPVPIGESADVQLFLANSRALLTAHVASDATVLPIDHAGGFNAGNLLTVEQETMRIVSGAGTTSLTVVRGLAGTTAVAHDAAAVVCSGYDFTDIAITPSDNIGSDETGWVQLAATQDGLDEAVEGAALEFASKPAGTVLSVWLRISAPADELAAIKDDLSLAITATRVPATLEA
jgi:hypothetical protein